MQAEEFYTALVTEVTSDRLPEVTQHALRQYYGRMLTAPWRIAALRRHWLERTAPMREILAALPIRSHPYRILDAGCGLGTEALYWAMQRLDVEVLALDISEDRLGVARTRKTAYEQQLGHPLAVHFVSQDVFEALQETSFDLIWTMEALSHIEPAGKFLQQAATNLQPSGRLVISDSHLLNPLMLMRLLQLRLRGVAVHSHRVTADGQMIAYAQERLFTPMILARELRRAGFTEIRTYYCGYIPPQLAHFPALYAATAPIETLFRRLSLVRTLGALYTLEASKA